MKQLNTLNKLKNLTFKTLEDRFKAVHGNRYIYNDVIYDGMGIKVNITCKVHGVFSQTPTKHTAGRNCPKCAAKSRYTSKRTFTKLEIEIEANKYNNVTDFREAQPSMYRIAWKRFGKEFLDRICEHMHKRNRQGTTESFTSTLESDYILQTPYINSHTHVALLHAACGNQYNVKPYHYTNGSRCPKCAGSSCFDKTKDSTLYYFKVTYKDIVAYKIGITNLSVAKRYHKHERDRMSEIVEFPKLPGVVCYNLEQKLLKELSVYKYIGIPLLKRGNTELFSIDILQQIKDEYANITNALQAN